MTTTKQKTVGGGVSSDAKAWGYFQLVSEQSN
ncbi:hypothetical protein ACUXIN_002573 [Staphylococcus cohnii]